MQQNDEILESLTKELLGLKDEYRAKSETIIQKMKECAALFTKTNDVLHMKKCQQFKKDHDSLSQAYQKKIDALDKKLSQAIKVNK